MHFEEALPELKKSPNPRENKNGAFMVQAKLITRRSSGESEEEWVLRYGATFRKLYDTDEAFREAVNDPDISDDGIHAIQERLNAEVHH